MRRTLLFALLAVLVNVLCARISDLLHIGIIPFISFFFALITGVIIVAFAKDDKLKRIGHGLLWGSLASFILAIIAVFNDLSHWGC